MFIGCWFKKKQKQKTRNIWGLFSPQKPLESVPGGAKVHDDGEKGTISKTEPVSWRVTLKDNQLQIHYEF